MPWETAMNYSTAKEMELALRQADGGKVEGIGDFLSGKYRPGFGSADKAQDKG
jgi:hypothetical protein